MNLIKKMDIRLLGIITFLIVLAIKIFFCIFALPIRTLSDELATLSGAAYLAGYDWSALVSNAGYYGLGFTSFLFPFFKLFDDPILIYRGILCVCAIVQSLSVFIVFYVSIHFFHIQNRLLISLIAIASSFFVVTRATIAYNEHILILISWICMLLLLKLIEYNSNIKKKRTYTFVLLICLSYALTIHTRSLILWFALIATIIFYAWTNKKLLVSPFVCIVTGVVGIALSRLFVSFMQKTIWISDSGEQLRNASVPIPEISNGLFSVDKWHAWIDIIIGQINTINIFSGGIVLLFIIIFFRFLWNKILRKDKRKENLAESKMDIMGSVLIFFIMCIAMTIFAQSITWLPEAAQAVNEGIFNNNYGTKAFTYIRYIGPYCGPLFMTGCLWIIQYTQRQNDILIYFKISLAIFCAVSVFWIMCVVPYFHQTTSTNIIEVYIPFSWTSVEVDRVSLMIILPATVVIGVLNIIYGVLLKKAKWQILFLILCVLYIYEYAYNAINWDLPTQKQNYYEIGYDVNNYIREKAVDHKFPDKIYVQDVRQITDHQIYYEIQFMLYDYKIIPLLDESDIPAEENIVIITNQNNDFSAWIENGYICTHLNDKITILEKYGK